MAVRTYSELQSDVVTYLDTNPPITASEHKTLETNIIDTLFNQGNGSGARPYKVYTALLTQTGVNAPVATVLENTLGGTVVWTYTGVGQYKGTLVAAFTVDKTWHSISSNQAASTGVQFSINRNSSDEIIVETASWDSISTWDSANDILISTSIEIRVYP